MIYIALWLFSGALGSWLMYRHFRKHHDKIVDGFDAFFFFFITLVGPFGLVATLINLAFLNPDPLEYEFLAKPKGKLRSKAKPIDANSYLWTGRDA